MFLGSIFIIEKLLPLVLEVFILAFLVFFSQRVLILNSRADIATLFFGFLSIAPVRLTAALTSFSRAACFIRVLPRWHRAPASLWFLSSRLCVLFSR